MKNRCQIQIAGVGLSVTTDYTAEYVGKLAQRINQTIDEMTGGNHANRMQAALLCLLDAYDAKEKAEEELAKMKKKAKSDKLDMEILQIENEKLKKNK